MSLKKAILYLLLCSVSVLSSQNDIPKISITIDNQPLTEVFKTIESQTEYKLYYIDKWFNGNTISVNYTDIFVDQLLKKVLAQTDINFFIKDNTHIYLTKNNVVYNTLPEDFFSIYKKKDTLQSQTSNLQTEKTAPLFTKKIATNNGSKITTYRIGKENATNLRRTAVLSGKITNVSNGKPISDLSIVIQERQKGTSTGKDGSYKIELPIGTHILTVQGLGYETRNLRVIMYNDGALNLRMQDSAEALDEVVITGNRDRNVEEAITGIIKIEVEQIKTMPLVLGERDILKAALTLPGIANAGEGASGFNVRGGKTDQNLVLLDDGVIYNPTHFFGIFSALNPFSTGSATIYKGSIPAEFGGRLSSVFDLKTKTPNTSEFSGEAAIGPVTSTVVLETPIVKDKSGLLVGGRATYSEWILRSLDNDDLRNSQASFFDIIAKYSHSINENNDIKATGYYSRDAFSITSDSIFAYSNRMASLRWNHKFNEKNRGRLILTNSQYKFNIEFDGKTNTDFDLEYVNNESEFKAEFDYLHSKIHKFKYGLSAKLYEIDPGRVDPLGPDSETAKISIPRERALETALFISDNYKVSDKLRLEAGVRFSLFSALGEGIQRIYEDNGPRNASTFIETRAFDKNEIIKTYGGPEFRISGRYFLSSDLSIKASFNNTFQYVHTLNSNTTVSQTDTYKLSDLNIKPQKANLFSLGIFKNIEGNKYELSFEGYYKTQRNLLDFKVGAQLLLNEQVEAEVLQGDGKAYGVELLLRKNEGRLNGWLSYTYARSFIRLNSEFSEERVNNGDFFPTNYDKPHDFSLVTNYKFTRRFSASANFVYQTGRPATFPLGNFEFNDSDYVFFSDRNSFRIPDFYRLDLSFNVEGTHKIKKFAHSFWNISVYNVLGRNNPYSVFFVTEDGKVKALQSSVFAVPVPTITYNFKF
ncbi:TonB-dependent receptor [Winogradskyella flava]|uniref:TonB-dependent receptor n=1 Tax=Winogradskyella flava TaxID=1884876 RepID=A0A842ILY0_9FLAO|nr:TonB-dependent receptor [Winogradskyella flava]MBC2843731.1 TonB-dependent receptor [Winogradskyella flava]